MWVRFPLPAQGIENGSVVSYSKLIAPIAQLVEQIPLKDKVPGSSPGRRTR